MIETISMGKLSMQLRHGALYHVCYDEVEIIQKINFAFRDSNWATLKPTFQNFKISRTTLSCKIDFEAHFSIENTTIFVAKVKIEVFDNQVLKYTFEGVSHHDFLTNRLGLYVLHPIEHHQNIAVKLEHVDGLKTKAVFPPFIAPHQPFLGIKNMQYTIAGVNCCINFEGDIFETEDQRNWGDVSYKTYCTPLELPFPKKVEKSQTISQSVAIELNGFAHSQNIKVDQKEIYPKSIGLGLTKICPERKVFQNLKIQHFRIEVDFSLDWESYFKKQFNSVVQNGYTVELVLIFSDKFKKEWLQIKTLIENNLIHISSIGLLNDGQLVTSQLVIDFIPIVRQNYKGKIGIGTNYNFTEINRERFNAQNADFIFCAFQPQEHSTEDEVVLDNVKAVQYMGETCMEIYKKPLHLSPITLKKRFNPYATDKTKVVQNEQDRVDDRQKEHFCKKWTDALLKVLGESNIQSSTFFETTGPLGIMDENYKPYPVFESFAKHTSTWK